MRHFSVMLCLILLGIFSAENSVYASHPLQNAGVSVEPASQPPQADVDLFNTIGDLLFTLTPAVSKASQNQKNGVGFYRIDIGGKYRVDAHFDRFKVGCTNGLENCDIDIDNLELKAGGHCHPSEPCYATVSRPSLEFAIRHPSSLEKRRLIGMRLLFDETLGRLNAGVESRVPNGINMYSGYIPIQGTGGKAKTAASRFGTGQSGEQPVQGAFFADVIGCTSGCGVQTLYTSIPEESEGLFIPPLDVNFEIPSFEIYGPHIAAVVIRDIKALIPDVLLEPDRGSLMLRAPSKICVTPAMCVERVRGYFRLTISGMVVKLTIDEALGYIHSIPMDNTPFYVGLQRETLQWPKAAERAETGWWLSFQKPVNIGYIFPQELLDVAPMLPSLGTSLTSVLKQTPVTLNTSAGLTALTKGILYKDLGALHVQQTVELPLRNIPLSRTDPWPNGIPPEAWQIPAKASPKNAVPATAN